MNPVRTEESNIIYKGPKEGIGDLWCHRVRPGIVRSTWEPTEEELELLKAGGRVTLTIYREPISPVMLQVVSKESSEPVGVHGFKIDESELRKEEDNEEEEGEAEQSSHSENGSASLGSSAEAGPS